MGREAGILGLASPAHATLRDGHDPRGEFGHQQAGRIEGPGQLQLSQRHGHKSKPGIIRQIADQQHQRNVRCARKHQATLKAAIV